MEQQNGVLVADLSGYTALTEAHGARTAADLVKRFVELVNKSITGSSRLVQRVGDEALIVGNKVDDLLKTALQLQSLVQSEDEFLAVHAGIHYGDLLEEDGSFYGSTLNLASRIAAHSAGGQVLCSVAAISALAEDFWVTFKSQGYVQFKNVREPVEVFSATYPIDNSDILFDPVCRMGVSPDKAIGPIHYAGKTYIFCTLSCLNSFSGNPDLYAS